MANSPKYTKLVLGRLPVEKLSFSNFIVADDTARKLTGSNRLSAIGEYVGLIFNDGILESPVAIFQGLRRPYIRDGMDHFVYVYISNPKITYYYSPRDQFDGTGPHIDRAPANSVFAIFVSMSPLMLATTAFQAYPSDVEVRGVILAWEWTLASASNPKLPDDYLNRYRRMVWPPP